MSPRDPSPIKPTTAGSGLLPDGGPHLEAPCFPSRGPPRLTDDGEWTHRRVISEEGGQGAARDHLPSGIA
eukprot:8798888-Alexandrium_andersonii.AAC.1